MVLSRIEKHAMHGTKEIIRKAESLPVEERVRVVDSLLRSLNPPDSSIDKKWAATAKKRLAEIRSGLIKPIPGNIVFEKVQRRYRQ